MKVNIPKSEKSLNHHGVRKKVKTKQTCKKPLKGAKPVPGPTIIIGTVGSAGSLKLDCLTKIGAQLHS
jgi:hypothetical protein